jgi:hypothetical protein
LCATLRLLGPFEGITPRPTEFKWEWNGPEDITGITFQLVFFNYEGNFAGSFFTDQTSLVVNVGQVPTGSELQWLVLLYKDDKYICGTLPTPVIFRLADPFAPTPKPSSSSNFSAQVTACVAFGAGWGISVSWSGADPGDTVTLRAFDLDSGANTSNTSSGSSGVLSVGSSGSSGFSNIVIFTSSGDSVSLGTCP